MRVDCALTALGIHHAALRLNLDRRIDLEGAVLYDAFTFFQAVQYDVGIAGPRSQVNLPGLVRCRIVGFQLGDIDDGSLPRDEGRGDWNDQRGPAGYLVIRNRKR